jgi:hypothetical protein
MQRDRFLFSILAGIGILVILALVLFFVRGGNNTYADESTPQGVARNYFLALQKQDYDRAYTYLAEFTGKPTLSQFRQQFLGYLGQEITYYTVDIGDLVTNPDQSAVLQVSLIRTVSNVFNDTYRNQQQISLVQQNGKWKILSAPYPYWAGEWSIPQAPVK